MPLLNSSFLKKVLELANSKKFYNEFFSFKWNVKSWNKTPQKRALLIVINIEERIMLFYLIILQMVSWFGK